MRDDSIGQDRVGSGAWTSSMDDILADAPALFACSAEHIDVGHDAALRPIARRPDLVKAPEPLPLDIAQEIAECDALLRAHASLPAGPVPSWWPRRGASCPATTRGPIARGAGSTTTPPTTPPRASGGRTSCSIGRATHHPACPASPAGPGQAACGPGGNTSIASADATRGRMMFNTQRVTKRCCSFCT